MTGLVHPQIVSLALTDRAYVGLSAAIGKQCTVSVFVVVLQCAPHEGDTIWG